MTCLTHKGLLLSFFCLGGGGAVDGVRGRESAFFRGILQ